MNLQETINLIKSHGFEQDSDSWKKPDKDGLMYYSFSKGDFSIEFEIDWDKKFSGWKTPFRIYFRDYTDAFYCNGGYIGWMGHKHLSDFNKPITKELLIELLKHYNWI